MKVQISGDIEEAKSANAARRNAKEDAADDAADDPNEEEEEQDRRKKKKRANDASSEKPSDFSKEEKLKKVFAVHPLTVNVKIEIGDGNFVELDFGYLTSLEAIAVKVSLVFNADNKEVLSHTHVELLGTQSLLAHLLQDEDAGTTSPNPATVYLLKHKLRMEKFPKSKMAEVGAAYKWAQLLGGLRFPDNADPEEEVRVDHAVCQTEIERIVGAIRRRFVARLALQRQISVLEAVKTKAVDLPIPKDLHDELPAGVQNRLHSWCAVKHEEYFSLKETQHLTRSGAVTSHDFFYRLQLNREPAILIALIAIGSQYPQTPPVFYLNLHWNNDEFNLRNSEKIRVSFKRASVLRNLKKKGKILRNLTQFCSKPLFSLKFSNSYFEMCKERLNLDLQRDVDETHSFFLGSGIRNQYVLRRVHSRSQDQTRQCSAVFANSTTDDVVRCSLGVVGIQTGLSQRKNVHPTGSRSQATASFEIPRPTQDVLAMKVNIFKDHNKRVSIYCL